jgi:hypothetical protein
MLLADRLFGSRLGLRIGPAGLDRLALVDPLAGPARGVDQDGAGEDEAFDREVSERAQQPPSAFDVDRLVKRALLAGEVEEGDEVDDRRDSCPMVAADLRQRLSRRVVGREVDLDQRVSQAFRRFLVEPDDPVFVPERSGDRSAEIAGRARDQQQRFVVWDRLASRASASLREGRRMVPSPSSSASVEIAAHRCRRDFRTL